MDPLERLYRHLVRTIRASFPQYLSRPFEVAELYQTIMPYRHHRRELGFDTNQDYEMALLMLLSGKGGYLVVEDRVRDALTRELAAANPDPGAFREFATTSVQLSADGLRAIDASPPAHTPVAASSAPTQKMAAAARPSTAASAGEPSPAPSRAAVPSFADAAAGVSASVATPASAQRASELGGVPVGAGEHCRYCGGDLPAGRRIVFCPHCGQNLTVVNCMACGTELELGWKFCTTCGRPNTPTASS